MGNTVLRRYSLETLALIATTIVPLQSFAGDWQITPRMTVSEEYTDNVTLVDQDTEDDLITSLTPGVSIRGAGARVSMNLDYNLRNQIYLDNSDFDRTTSQLASNADAEIVKNVFFLQANGSKSQRNGDNNGRRANRNRSRTNNETDVLTYQYGGRFNHHFGSWADFTSNYLVGESSNSGESTGSAGTGSDETLSLVLSSGRRIARTPISLRYSKQESDFDSGGVDKIESFTTNIAYVVSRKLRLDSEFGIDKNELGRSNNNRGEGFRWRVGGQFTPSPRTTLSGHWGERGFGETFDVAVNHTKRRFNFRLSYNQELRTTSQRLRDAILVPLTDITGQPIFDINQSSDFGVVDNNASINEEVSLSKRLQVSLRYDMRRTTLRANYLQADRVFQTSLRGEESSSFGINIRRSLRPGLNGNINATRDESTNNRGGTNEILRYGATLSYATGPHTNLNLSYQYADSNDEQFRSNDTYIENALTASLTISY